MAEPARKLHDYANDPKHVSDPVGGPIDPLDPRVTNTTTNPVDNRRVVEGRGAGNGAIIAAIVVVLAVIAYFVFAPGTSETPAPNEPATTSEPAAPATPAPEATAPAEPAPDAATPAPDATAPTEPATPPATEPNATQPAPTEPPAQ
jgi:hypothetical protein